MILSVSAEAKIEELFQKCTYVSFHPNWAGLAVPFGRQICLLHFSFHIKTYKLTFLLYVIFASAFIEIIDTLVFSIM